MAKTFGVLFVVIFLFNFVVFNWNEVSPFFNYNLLAGEIGRIFEKKEIRAQVEKIGIPKEGIFLIEKIGVESPIVFTQSLEEIDKDLKKGVALFPQSAFPGQKGLAIILGHSGPPGWPDVDFDTVFSRVGELDQGDEIKAILDGKTFIFRVNKKVILEQGKDFPYSLDDFKSNLLILSCWPPGKNYKRIGVQAELVS